MKVTSVQIISCIEGVGSRWFRLILLWSRGLLDFSFFLLATQTFVAVGVHMVDPHLTTTAGSAASLFLSQIFLFGFLNILTCDGMAMLDNDPL